MIRGGRRAALAAIYLAAVMPMTGTQLIAPILPTMRAQLGLTDTQVALVLSAYALPSIFLVIPVGIAADRFGRDRFLSVALAVFGITAIGQLLFPTYAVIIWIRVLQGTAAAAILPLSMTIIGDLTEGLALIRAQGGRSIAMTTGSALLPVLGALLVTITWYTPFAAQLLAVGAAWLAWWALPSLPRTAGSPFVLMWDTMLLVRRQGALSLQVMALTRFLLKHAYLTYFPILLTERGMSIAATGLALSLTSVAGAISAYSAGRLAARTHPPLLLAVALGLVAVGLSTIGLSRTGLLAAAASLLFGAADGTYGVLHNALVTVAVPAETRASFVALASTAKNLGKTLGPVAAALSLALFSLDATFVLMAALSLSVIAFVPSTAQLAGRLRPTH